MEQSCSPLAVEIVPGKHCDFSTYLAKRAGAQSGACAEVQFPDYATVLWSPGSRIFQGNTAISAFILPRERQLSLVHAQMCSFLITEECSGPLAVEILPGKHCDFSTNVTKRARTQSGAWPKVKFPEYGTVLWSPVSRNISRKALRFQLLSCQERESSVCRMRRCAVP
jgi:hypothetical protein